MEAICFSPLVQDGAPKTVIRGIGNEKSEFSKKKIP